MVALLLLGVLGQVPPSLRVSYRVALSEPILDGKDFRRDGSLVGSYGEMGLHDGHEFPLIVRHGKQIHLSNEAELNGHEVAAILPNNRFVVLTDNQHPQAAILTGSRLVLKGPTKPKPVPVGVSCKKTLSNPLIDKLFPVPEDMRDTTRNECVFWYNYLKGSQLAQVEISWHMEYGHRAAMRDEKGHIRTLEQCIPGLSDYEVRGIDHVDKQGWFVVDAVRKTKHEASDVQLGFGDVLFWIEPAVMKRNSK